MMAETDTQTTSSLTPFHVVIVVWGERYVDTLLRVTFPTLLAHGNLPALSGLVAPEIFLVTTPHDENTIRNTPIFDQIRQHATMAVHHLDPQKWHHKYDAMVHGHHVAMQRAAGRGVCLFLAPDALICDGMLKRLHDIWLGGRRIIAGYGPRLVGETLLPELFRLPEYHPDAALSLPPRRLVEIALPHLHADVLAHRLDSPNYPQRPYMGLWDGPDGDGMLIRCLNIHPYLFDCRDIGPDVAPSIIDWDLVPQHLTNPNALHVETDSDSFNIWGISSLHDVECPARPNRFSPQRLAHWMLKNGYPLVNRLLASYPLCYHYRDLTPRWAELAVRSREEFATAADPARIDRFTRALFLLLLDLRARTASLHRGLRRFRKRAKARISDAA